MMGKLKSWLNDLQVIHHLMFNSYMHIKNHRYIIDLRWYEVRSSKNRTIALDCAILITETFWILENFPWVMQTKTEQNGFFPTLIVIAQSLLETTPYPLPLPRFHSFLLMPKEPKSTNSSPPCHWSQIVFWITQKVFVV